MSHLARNQSSMLNWLPEENMFSRAELLDWIDEVLTEAYAELSRLRRPLLYVKESEVKCEIPYPVFDSAQADDAQFFSFGNKSVFLGVGRAREWEMDSESFLKKIAGTLDLGAISSSPSKTWLLGGWSFPHPIVERIRRADEKGRGIWKPFPYSRWIVPAILLTSTNGRTSLIMAVCPEPSARGKQREYYSNLADILVTSALTQPSHLPTHLRSTDLPSRKEWVSLVRNAVGAISKGELKKVVLSRSKRILFDRNLSPSTVLRRLVGSNPGSTAFAMKIGNTTFLGATPEQLLSLKDCEIQVDCLAASAPRSQDTLVDESLGLNLLSDEKSNREHDLVLQNVTNTLSAICLDTGISGKPILKKLATVQHLQTIVRGRLRPGVGIWSAALSLWPTPATGGEPKEHAIRWVRRHEQIDRGWYSGVVGCVNVKGDGNLVVAIRSGVIRGNCAVAFAGSGIVAGSNPEAEFEETNWKMGAMMEALGIKGTELLK